MRSVTFATNCWEKDWDILLKTNFLEKKIIRNSYPFTKRILLINTDDIDKKITNYAKKRVDEGILTEYYYVKDYAKEALNFLDVSKNDLGKGYYYSISELVGIYLCNTEYFLYFMGDCWLDHELNWINACVNEMEKNDNNMVATLIMNKNYDLARTECIFENEDFFIDIRFSDQCFLIKTKNFKLPIYNEYTPYSEHYPKYGGESFEKRIYSWMRNHNYYRLVYKKGDYVHRNFTRNNLLKRINIITRKYD